jgi:hypothetical protein
MSTATYTKTVADVRKVLNKFGADFSMIGQSTGLRSRTDVETTTEDLILFADAGYLEEVRLILWDAAGNKVRGRRYAVSNSAIGWSSDDPGDNLWPRTLGGSLHLTAILADSWWKLNDAGKDTEKQRLGIAGGWGKSASDTSFSGMTGQRDRQYASNGFGIERWTYR